MPIGGGSDLLVKAKQLGDVRDASVAALGAGHTVVGSTAWRLFGARRHAALVIIVLIILVTALVVLVVLVVHDVV